MMWFISGRIGVQLSVIHVKLDITVSVEIDIMNIYEALMNMYDVVYFWQDWGAAECDPCEAGHYCDSTTTSRDNMYAYKICPAGMTCDYSRTVAPDLENDPCPTGYYCLSGDKVLFIDNT